MNDQPSTTVRIGTFRDGRPAHLTLRQPSLLELLAEGEVRIGAHPRVGKSRLPYAAPDLAHAPRPPRTGAAGAGPVALERAVDPPPLT